MRRTRLLLFLALLGVSPCAWAQLIPWSELPKVIASEENRLRRTVKKVRPVFRREIATSGATLALSQSAVAEPLLTQPLEGIPGSILISSFAPLPDTGTVRPGTSWVGNVVQNTSSITVGGNAADDNGWGAGGLAINASGMTFLSITAQRDAGNQAPALFVQFEDRILRTKVFSVDTSLFAVGALTTVRIPLGSWTIDFGATDIASWSIGGGSVGTIPFRLTFDEISFGTSAIPEPGTYAAMLAGLSLVGAVIYRRRRRSVFVARGD